MGLHNRKSLEPYIKDEVDFYEHQADGVRWLWNMKSFLLADDMGLGKAATVNEPVLTPNGWSTMGSISAGDQVIAHDGLPTTVKAVYPQGIREIVKVTFSDKSFSMCDWEHLWEVNTPVRKMRGNPGRVLTTKRILTSRLKDAAGNRKHYIPMVKPVEFANHKDRLTLDPYLLGVLLGDGCLSGKNGIGISTDVEIINNIKLPEGAYITKYAPRIDYPDYFCTARINGTTGLLESLNLRGTKSESKFIPEQYLWGSIETRIAVLQGLIDTDGTPVQSRGKPATTIEYGTVSKQLSEDVRFLVQSLGGTVSVQEKTPTYDYNGLNFDGQLFYRMVLHLPSNITPFRLQRKLDKWTPRTKYEPTRSIESIEVVGEEEAVCISVENPRQLYVTRDFIVTHNTIEALTVFAIHCKKMQEKYGVDSQMLVVCPVSLKVNWADEIEKFTGFEFVTLDGPPIVREELLNHYGNMGGSKILIVNYEQVKAHLARLNKFGFDVVCADEAHYLKNHKSQRTQAFRSLRTDRSFMLTGSPLLNNVNELWVLLDRIQPKQWGTYWGFTQRFCAFGGWKGKQIIGPKNEAELKEDMGKVMLRRTKDEVLDLPDIQYITRTVELLPQQKKLYDKVVEELLLDTGNGDPDAVDNPMTKFLRLKQICGTTATVRSDSQDHSAKLDLAIEDANEIFDNDHKITSFTQFRPVQAAYIARLNAMNVHRQKAGGVQVPIFELNGDVPASQRQGIVNAWAAVTGPAILVCMIQVAGIGLNMTAARHGQFIDKLFVPMLNQQAVDRMHRIGSSKTQSVQIFDYQAKDTVEARVETILRTKKNLFENIVEQKEFEKKLIRTMMQELRK